MYFYACLTIEYAKNWENIANSILKTESVAMKRSISQVPITTQNAWLH